MSRVELSCPACKSGLRVPGAKPGRRVRCPRCGEVFTLPATTADAIPVAEVVSEAAPVERAATPASVLTEDDIFAKLATAEDPVATAAVVRKPKPARGEPGNSIPLDEAPPPANSRKSAKLGPKDAKPKSPAEKRRVAELDDDENRFATGINPLYFVGGLAVLAAGVLVLGVFAFSRYSDRKAEEVAAVQRERDVAEREVKEREVKERERAAVARRDRELNAPLETAPFKPESLDPIAVKPDPVKPDPVIPNPMPPEFPPVDPPLPVRPPVEPPAKGKLVFPAVVPVAIKAAPLAQARAELKLPGTVTDACVGGDGRYWCLLIGDEKQVAIFDVNEAKVTKFLPVAGGTVRIAAGMNKLVVAHPDAGTLTRYDLTTFAKEATVQSPVEKFDTILMGSASAGPLFVGQAPVDLRTFKAMEAPAGIVGRDNGMHYRISPDGHVIGSWSTSFSPAGLNVNTYGDTPVRPVREHTSVGFVVPAADGTTVTAAGVYDSTGKKLPGPDGHFLRLPAQEGRFYLTIPGGGGAQVNTGKGDIDKPTVVYATGEARALINLPDVTLPAGNEAWAKGDFFSDKKVLFTTEGQLIAVLAPTGDKLILHKFDLEAALTKAGVDYLFVTSRPPAAEAGKAFKYTPTVKSKKGGVTFKLDAGPEGLAVGADGTVTWDVPKDWAGGDNVVLTVSDKSGQEVIHTFTLALKGDAGGDVAVAPPIAPPVEPVVPAVARKPGLVRPAANPAKITPTKAADRAEIKLPGTVDMTCFGGGGRYVLLRIPSEKKVAVLDVCEGKVTKYLPIPEDGALIAAGNEHLFVFAPTANIMQRWNLTTFEKEATVAYPLKDTPRHLLVGHATDGPLFVVGPNQALDSKTFKEVELGAEGNGRGMAGHPQYPPTVRVSADGRVFAWHTRGLSPSGLSTLVLGTTDVKTHSEHTTVGAILPGPDGTLFTGGGLFTPELKPIGDKGRYQYWHHAPIPAAHGKMYLSIPPEDGIGARKTTPKVLLKMLGENKPLVDLSALAGLDVPKDHNQTAAKGLQLHDRVFLVPDAKVMAVLHATADKVTIHALDVEALLDKAGIDYLFVVSRPPGAVCGATFSYKPEVKSRKGGVKVKLDAGPDGMKVEANATVTWAVPANFPDTSVSVILTISDSSGQETFHTFTLPVATRP